MQRFNYIKLLRRPKCQVGSIGHWALEASRGALSATSGKLVTEIIDMVGLSYKKGEAANAEELEIRR